MSPHYTPPPPHKQAVKSRNESETKLEEQGHELKALLKEQDDFFSGVCGYILFATSFYVVCVYVFTITGAHFVHMLKCIHVYLSYTRACIDT